MTTMILTDVLAAGAVSPGVAGYVSKEPWHSTAAKWHRGHHRPTSNRDESRPPG